MKTKTLNTQIKNLPTTGSPCGFIRQLAGVDAQKYRDAHRCTMNAREDVAAGFAHLAGNTKNAEGLIGVQKSAVADFVKKFGELTVREYFETYGIEYSEKCSKRKLAELLGE